MVADILRHIRFKFANRGKHVHIDNKTDLQNIECGKYVFIAHHAQISNSTIGDYTSIGRYGKIQHALIGKFCSISWDVTIGAVSHRMKAVSTHAFSYRKIFNLCEKDLFLHHPQCEIGNDVWIGCGAIIMPGIKVNTGAIIGAGAVVTKDVDAYEVVAGVPARHVKYRFNEEIRNKLLKSEWWNLSSDVIRENINLFFLDNIDENGSILNDLLTICETGKGE